jgi:hypothetical protein
MPPDSHVLWCAGCGQARIVSGSLCGRCRTLNRESRKPATLDYPEARVRPHTAYLSDLPDVADAVVRRDEIRRLLLDTVMPPDERDVLLAEYITLGN